MKCKSCNVKIDSSFSFAIKNNQCPACGDVIMDTARLNTFLSLRALLDSNFKNIDTEKVANLIVANFELKQLFKEELTSEDKEGITSLEDEDPDSEHKETQMAEAKVLLKKMREEALDEAEADHWGLGDANGLVDAADTSVEGRMRLEQQQRADNIASGAQGSFRRG